jgi:hypothetical protein
MNSIARPLANTFTVSARRSMMLLPLLCAAALWANNAQAQLNVSEGRVSDAAMQPLDPARKANYNGAPATTGDLAAQATPDKQLKAAPKIEYRTNADKASRSSYFRLYDANRSLRSDRDGDGYHSEFRIRFDADVTVGDALVYAKLYIRRIGESNWRLYRTTDNFWIYGQSGVDDYFVDTTLESGFATDDYNVLIDLYEVGYSGIVATIDATDTSALAYIPLEEVGLDVPVELPGFAINDVASSLLIDSDNDGFYSKFRVTIDPDAMSSDTLYAVLWIRQQGGTWVKEHTSNDFAVDASGTADAHSFTIDWLNGYPTSHYDIQIDVYQSGSGLLVASAGSEWFELSQLPLEDAGRDTYVNPPTSGGGGGYTSSDEHGGSMSLWFVAALAGLLIAKKSASRRRLHAVVAKRAQLRVEK